MFFFVNLLEYKVDMVSIKTHLKGALGFRSILDIGFLFIVDIFRDVNKWSGSNPISIFCQILAVSPSTMDLVGLCPNLWWCNSREVLLMGIVVLGFDFSFVCT